MFNIFKKLFTKTPKRKFADYNTISGEDLPENDEFQHENKKSRSGKFPWSKGHFQFVQIVRHRLSFIVRV